MITKLFPTIIVALNIGAMVVYLLKGNARMTIYFLSAAVITASVTY